MPDAPTAGTPAARATRRLCAVVVATLALGGLAVAGAGAVAAAVPSAPMTIPVGDDPSGIAAYGGNVYVANYNSASVSVITAGSNAVVATVPITYNPYAIAADSSGVYVTNTYNSTLDRIDPDTNTVTAHIRVGTAAQGAAVGGGHVWVTSENTNTLYSVDETSLGVTSMNVGDNPMGVTYDHGRVYVANEADNSVTVIDPSTMSVVRTVNVGPSPVGIAAYGGSIWTTDYTTGQLSVIDESSLTAATTPANVYNLPHGLVGDAGRMWVTEAGAAKLDAVDTTRTVTSSVTTGSVPYAVTAAGGYLYVANSGSHTVSVVDEGVQPPARAAATGGNTTAVVHWQPPSGAHVGDVTGYRVLASTTPGAENPLSASACTANAPALLCTVTGLTNNTRYYFTVEAVTTTGISTQSPEATAVPGIVPGAPTRLTATAGNGQVSLSWSPPATTGSSAVRYEVLQGTTSDGETDVPCTTAATSCTATGLTNGTAYFFVVYAYNDTGDSPPSNEVSATPDTAPGAPTGLTAARGNGQVTLSWTAPSSNGGSAITGYQVFASTTSGGENTAGAAACSLPASTTTCVLNGLTNGTTYYVQVVAVNAVGQSAPSTEVSAVPATQPGAPTGVTATGGNGQVTVSWTAPSSNGGLAVTGYDVYTSTTPGGENTTGAASCATASGTALSCRVTGLANGTTYYFKVRALSSAGLGAASSEVSATPKTVPGAPTGLSATPGNGQVTVSWSAPSSNGGSAITEYDVFLATTSGAEQFDTNVGCSTTPPTTSCTVTGLTNGTTYWFSVEALNAIGRSSLTTPDVSAVPRTVPGAPTSLTAAGGNGRVSLFWSAPASTGGSAVTGYDVFVSTTPGGENTAGTPACANPAGLTACAVDGLANGVRYYLVVEAVNAAGPSVASNEVSATPASVPGAPTGLMAVRGDHQLTLSWHAPTDNGGSAITGYRVYVALSPGTEGDTGASVCDVTTTACVVSGLANGTAYYFVVEAINDLGHSAASVEASGTPAVLPGAPTGVKASPASGRVTVSWTRPAKTGSAPLTGYRVYVATSRGAEKNAKAPSCTAAARSTTCTVSGLANGHTYWFSVTALSSAGESSLASPDASAIPGPKPTIAVSGGHLAVAYGSTHKFTGTVQPHAAVALYRGTTRLAGGTATGAGAYSFAYKVTVSGSYSVLSDGQHSSTLALHVVKLTLAVSGSKPYRKGTHTISGAAPAGQTVALVEDGKTVAKATAGSKNTYRFTRSISGRHALRIVCDGVLSGLLTITAS